ncbi:MAG: hypothetical protein H7A53_09585 [Akkermansiaceae bacterium]|nr:hypothetical protein [Akkermansiaceae bacterium]
MPRSDDWNIVAPVIVEARAGNISWESLNAQVGDARMPVARIVHAMLALSSGWNQRLESMAILSFTMLSFFYFELLARHAFGRRPRAFAAMTLAGSLLTFWPAMGMYWTFPTMLCYAIGTSLAFAIIPLMRTPLPPEARAAGGAVLGFLACETFLSGWLAWLVLFGLTFLSAWEDHWSRPWRRAIALIGIGLILAIGIYIPGWHSHAGQPMRGGNPVGIGAYTLFFFRWLGSPFSFPPIGIDDAEAVFRWQMTVGLVVGILGAVCIAGITTVALLRCRLFRGEIRRIAPWLAIIGFSLAAGILVTAGRTRFSPSFCFLGRYISFSIWAYIGAAALFFEIWPFPVGKLPRRLAGAAIPLLLALYGFGFWRGLLSIESDHFATERIRCAFELMPLYVGKSPEIEGDVLRHPFSPPPAELWRLGNRVRQADLLPVPLVDEATWRARLREDSGGAAGKLESLSPKGPDWIVSGWAADTVHRHRAHGIFITAERPGEPEKLMGFAQKNAKRPKYEKKYRFREFSPHAGWIFTVEKERLLRQAPPGTILRAYAVDANTATFHRLDGEIDMPEAPAR